MNLDKIRSLTLPLLGLALCALCTGCIGKLINSDRFIKAEVRDLALQAYDEGIRFNEVGNFDLALDRFERSLAIGPRPATYYQIGQTRQSRGEPEEAALNYAYALAGAPDYQEARFVLLELGYKPPAEAEIKAESGVMESFIKQVETEAQVRRIEREEAEAQMTEEERKILRQRIRKRIALASERRLPTIEEVRATLFAADVDDDRIPRSTADYSERQIVLGTYPYHYANGQRFQRNKQYEKAIQEYRFALEIDPDRIDARLNAGDCYLNLERYILARQFYEGALNQFPKSARPLLKMGNFFERLKRSADARQFYVQAIQRDPDYVEAYNNLAALEIREKNFDQAVDYIGRLIRIDPAYPLAYLNLGVAHENAGNARAAVEAYRRYIQLGGERASEVQAWIEDLKDQL